jgi:hypothetical protein
MKGIVLACLLMSLHSTAQAYEADIHYSTTYALARAVGWTQAEALTIASANQAMDENQDTVAALEVDATSSPSFAGYATNSLRQAEKNLEFHCFSKTREHGDRISADVRKVISGHFAAIPGHDADVRKNARRLIALGVALHCQQDAYAHVGFGGSCGSYSGSCYGHTHQTFLDEVVFGLLGKHHYNPDHPGVSGEWLPEALQGTAGKLAAHRPKSASRPIPASALTALSNSLRGSGLDLPDEVRRDCNRYIAGKWLHDFHSGRTHDNPDTTEKLAPDVARTCRNPSLASATIVRIPDPRFPRLKPDASPYLVRADGSYVALPGIHAAGIAALMPNYDAYKVQLSHWTQLLALPRSKHVALMDWHRDASR